MTLEPLFVWILIGAIAGWLASILAKDDGYILLGRIVVGMLGAGFGVWLFGTFGPGGSTGEIVGAVFGSVALLFLVRFVRAPRDQV